MTTVYDDPGKKINEWDFEKNLGIDVLEESTDSEKNASWICSNCGLHYEGKIKTHSTYQCPHCGNIRLLEDLHSYEKMRRKAYIKGLIMPIFTSFIATFAFNAVKYEWNKITSDIIISLMFSLLSFILIAVFVWSLDQNRIINSPIYIARSRLLYNLIATCDRYDTLRMYYKDTIANRLYILCKNDQWKIDKEEFINIIKNENRKIVCEWFESSDKAEVLFLLKVLKTSYFDKLYSRFETKKMIDFEPNHSLMELVASVTTGIISLFLSVFSDISDWSIVGQKLILTALLILVYIIYIVVSHKNRLRATVSSIWIDTIYVSSSIAKIINAEKPQNTNSLAE